MRWGIRLVAAEPRINAAVLGLVGSDWLIDIAARITIPVEFVLQYRVVRDALAAGLDWWALGEVLAMHPQAAFEAYANLLEGTRTPARQRPALAVVCTAGLVCAHDMDSDYGVDLDDLDPAHSLTIDPTVVRLRGPRNSSVRRSGSR
ncbi:hypothetical protein [Nonomuraea angiospora]